MTPINPKPVDHAAFVEFAKDQPEYLTLPAYVDIQGVVTTEWEPTADELAILLNGGNVRLRVFTFGRALQPVMLDACPAS